MAKGKQTCKILKEIRKQIAADNDIGLVVSECTYKGDCLGTCPKCESEVRYLERELEKRQRLGKAAVFAGMSIGTLLSAAACGSTSDVAKSNTNCTNGTEMTDDTIHRPLAGDVVAIAPEKPKPDTIINEPLMGIVRLFHETYSFDTEYYQKSMKEKFAFDGMEGMSVVSGTIEYEHVGKGDLYDNLEELVNATKKFTAPNYQGGEKKFCEDLGAKLKDHLDAGKYKGDMEVAFTVDMSRLVKDVEVVKGFDVNLDVAVVAAFEQMEWNPAVYETKDGLDIMPFECRCIKKIHFPIDTH